MMIVDSCGWLEWFTDGPLADQYHQYLIDRSQLIVPAIVIYEAYKFLRREIDEEKALSAVAYMKDAIIAPLDDTLALVAADKSLAEGLAMADAIILATGHYYDCPIITSDADLKGKPGVQFLSKG